MRTHGIEEELLKQFHSHTDQLVDQPLVTKHALGLCSVPSTCEPNTDMMTTSINFFKWILVGKLLGSFTVVLAYTQVVVSAVWFMNKEKDLV